MNRLAELLWICGVMSLVLPGLAEDISTPLHATINTYNDAGVSEKVLAQAIQEASRVFSKAGIESHWIECQTSKDARAIHSDCQSPSGPGHSLALRLARRSSVPHDSDLGVAYLPLAGTGTYANVFVDAVEEKERDWHTGLSILLGHVMAHEIGHLLLGTNSHSPSGIMQSKWHRSELRSMAKGALLFTAQQAQSIRSALGTSAVSAPTDFPFSDDGTRDDVAISGRDILQWRIIQDEENRFPELGGLQPSKRLLVDVNRAGRRVSRLHTQCGRFLSLQLPKVTKSSSDESQRGAWRPE